jgi:hypothetical protein
MITFGTHTPLSVSAFVEDADVHPRAGRVYDDGAKPGLLPNPHRIIGHIVSRGHVGPEVARAKPANKSDGVTERTIFIWLEEGANTIGIPHRVVFDEVDLFMRYGHIGRCTDRQPPNAPVHGYDAWSAGANAGRSGVGPDNSAWNPVVAFGPLEVDLIAPSVFAHRAFNHGGTLSAQ